MPAAEGEGAVAGLPALRCPVALEGRRRNVRCVAEFEDRDGDDVCRGESDDGILDGAVSSMTAAASASCGWTCFTNGMRTCWLGAAGFLNIGLGRGRDGDGVHDVDVDALGLGLGLGLLLAIRAAVGLGDDGDGGGCGCGWVEIEGAAGGWRLRNLIRNFKDSVVSWRTGTGAVVGSALTNPRGFSSPSLSSSITSVGGSDVGRLRCGRGMVGLVVRAGPGVGPRERRAVVLRIWLVVWPGEVGIGDAGADVGGAGAGGGVGAGKSGAREGVVSSKVR